MDESPAFENQGRHDGRANCHQAGRTCLASRAYVLDWGPLGLWWGMLLADVISALTGVVWFRLGKWKSAIIDSERPESSHAQS